MNKFMKRMANKQRKGFTLVELVVVILIIAILAAAIFLGGATVIKQAREAQVKSDLNNMATYVQDMLYENPDLQYFKGDANQAGAYGTQESYTFTTKDDKYYSDTNWDTGAFAAAEVTDPTVDAQSKALPVLALLNTDYMTDDFQIGDATRDAWDVPYLWSYGMSPSTGKGDPASCIIVINSMGVNTLDETSDASTTPANTAGVAKNVIDDLGTTYMSATEVVEGAEVAGLTSDDYGVVIVMIDGQVSVDYYGF